MKSKFLQFASAMFLALIGLCLMGGGVSPAAYNLIQDEAVNLTRRSTLNFTGTGITCADATTKTTCDVPGAVNYSQSFTAQTTVALAHGLGTTAVITDCYDGSDVQIIPNTTTITDANTVTVTFLIAQTGKCVVNGAGTPTPAYTTIESAATPLTQRSILNFVSGVTCVDNAGATRTDCTGTATYHYQYISGGSLIAGTTAFPSGLNANAVSLLTANAPIVGGATGPAMSTLAAGGSSVLLQYGLPPTWNGSSAITLDIDGVYDVATSAGTIVLEAFSTDLAVGANAQVVTWSSASSTSTVNATNNAFPNFPAVRWSLNVPTAGLVAGDLIYISIARPSGDTFSANAYIVGVNVGVKY